MVGGMPLAFMQEDFLVTLIFLRKKNCCRPHPKDGKGNSFSLFVISHPPGGGGVSRPDPDWGGGGVPQPGPGRYPPARVGTPPPQIGQQILDTRRFFLWG